MDVCAKDDLMPDELTNEERLALLVQVLNESNEVEQAFGRAISRAASRARAAHAEAFLAEHPEPNAEPPDA